MASWIGRLALFSAAVTAVASPPPVAPVLYSSPIFFPAKRVRIVLTAKLPIVAVVGAVRRRKRNPRVVMPAAGALSSMNGTCASSAAAEPGKERSEAPALSTSPAWLVLIRPFTAAVAWAGLKASAVTSATGLPAMPPAWSVASAASRMPRRHSSPISERSPESGSGRADHRDGGGVGSGRGFAARAAPAAKSPVPASSARRVKFDMQANSHLPRNAASLSHLLTEPRRLPSLGA